MWVCACARARKRACVYFFVCTCARALHVETTSRARTGERNPPITYHSAGSPPSAAAHITPTRCRCGSSEPTRGEDVLGVSSVPAQIWPGAAGAHEVLGLLQEAQVHHRRRREAAKGRPSRPRKPFVAKEAQARELDLPHGTSKTSSFPACAMRSFSVGRQIGVGVGPGTSSSCAARTGRPKSAPPSACLYTRWVGNTYVPPVGGQCTPAAAT